MKTLAETSKYAETPLMKQYNVIKGKYPDALLLFRIGDFYETFGEDAIITAKTVGITLTRRANGSATYIELAGFPHHALDTYLPRLVHAGYRVAICDQLENPKLTKTIVKRGVTELVTPGVSYNDKVLNHNKNNFLASVHLDKDNAGIALLDISTGEFLIAEGTHEYVDKILSGFKPSEVLVQKNKMKDFTALYGDKFYTSNLDEWVFMHDFANEILLKHFDTRSLKGFGVEKLNLGIIAAGAAMHYLADTAHDKVKHITSISRIEEDRYVWLDKFTIRNLELFSTGNDEAVTLIDVLDETISPMGSRMLKRWLALPLKELTPINERLNLVEYFIRQPELADLIKGNIKQIGDLERLISRVAVGKVTPREIVQIKRALYSIEPIREACFNADTDELKKLGEQLNPCALIRNRIEKEIVGEPPVALNKGSVISEGVSQELDDLRRIAFSGKDYLIEIQQRETERTGISSLKVGFNNVFGYFLEVRNTHKDKVPTEWIRKQTLSNGERYITEELKEYEDKILGAEDKILALETELFNKLLFELLDYIKPIQLNAILIARLDCLLSFAVLAQKNNYVRPILDESYVLNIKNGRHPVIEHRLPIGEQYIANDIFLDDKTQQIIMITGPNMSGKSALLRQTALIVLMAQMGCFVPADSASIGLVDKIFTRVGASDNISSGESTFMVEMNETASILNNVSERSLILLDEIGRGTSTYDGISIAWAISEYLHELPGVKAKTLFATHYHELNEMTNTFNRIKNFNVSVKEIDGRVIFLRKLQEGGSEHSFGIHVAKMAGMPKSIIKRADEMLKELEGNRSNGSFAHALPAIAPSETGKDGFQLSFFQLDDPLLKDIKDRLISIDINNLTPIEALNKLNEIKRLLKG